jgi:hypothetical protein
VLGRELKKNRPVWIVVFLDDHRSKGSAKLAEIRTCVPLSVR